MEKSQSWPYLGNSKIKFEILLCKNFKMPLLQGPNQWELVTPIITSAYVLWIKAPHLWHSTTCPFIELFFQIFWQFFTKKMISISSNQIKKVTLGTSGRSSNPSFVKAAFATYCPNRSWDETWWSSRMSPFEEKDTVVVKFKCSKQKCSIFINRKNLQNKHNSQGGSTPSPFLWHPPLDPACPLPLFIIFASSPLFSVQPPWYFRQFPHPHATPCCPNPTNQTSLL